MAGMLKLLPTFGGEICLHLTTFLYIDKEPKQKNV